MGPIVNQLRLLASYSTIGPERDRQAVGAVEKVLDHSPLRVHLGVEAAEKDPDHSPEHVHLVVGAVERDLDRSPRLQGLSYGMRKLSQHLQRRYSATQSLHLEQVAPKRLQRATLTWNLRVGKLTRRHYMYSCSIMKQESAVSKR
jgi:hypothetical protein